jgi:hypothetical protein
LKTADSGENKFDKGGGEEEGDVGRRQLNLGKRSSSYASIRIRRRFTWYIGLGMLMSASKAITIIENFGP